MVSWEKRYIIEWISKYTYITSIKTQLKTIALPTFTGVQPDLSFT